MKGWPAKHGGAIIATTLALVTLAVYLPVGWFDFIQHDDPAYVYENPLVSIGLTGRGFVWAFTQPFVSNWHPLTWLSHMLDCQLFGLRPGWHHLENVGWHIANTVLVFLGLRRLTGQPGRSAFVAALFALHPLHVESVAWISERKDVLSTFFGLLAVWGYIRYTEIWREPVLSQRRVANVQWYAFSLFFFTCSLLCKAMWVTLPGVLLLLDFWPLQRVFRPGSTARNWRRVVLDKIPFAVLAAGACLVTFRVQSDWGAVTSGKNLPLMDRLEHVAVAYATYLGKTFWPTDLNLINPLTAGFPAWQFPVALLTLGGITFWALWHWKQRPHLIAGWLFFLGTLVPVIGLVQAGNQAWADRYTYVPLLGIFVAVTWQMADRLKILWGERASAVGAGLGAAVLVTCAGATGHQLQFWRDSRTVFGRAIAVHQDNPVAQHGLGRVAFDEGRLEEARTHYAEALRSFPDYPEALADMGIVLAQTGEVNQGVELARRAIQLNPRMTRGCWILANWLPSRNEYAAAIACFREVVRVVPDSPGVLNDLAWLLAACPDAAARNGADAVRLASRACELTGYRDPQLMGTLAAAEAEAGDFSKAVSVAEQAIQKATTAGRPDVAKVNQELLELYRSGRAYHESTVPVQN